MFLRGSWLQPAHSERRNPSGNNSQFAYREPARLIWVNPEPRLKASPRAVPAIAAQLNTLAPPGRGVPSFPYMGFVEIYSRNHIFALPSWERVANSPHSPPMSDRPPMSPLLHATETGRASLDGQSSALMSAHLPRSLRGGQACRAKKTAERQPHPSFRVGRYRLGELLWAQPRLLR